MKLVFKLFVLLSIVLITACSGGDSETFTIYSGRNETLVQPVIDQINEQTDFKITVRYGGTAQLAATIVEEGQRSPADLFYAQDAGALGALQRENRLLELPESLLEEVNYRLRSPEGNWIGITGRARVLNYNSALVSESELPDSIWGLTSKHWRGEVGWAPQNASFQAFVTALRQIEGEKKAREWLEAMIANGVQSYPRNTPIVQALGRGEIKIGLVNNYYLHRFKAEDPHFPVAAHFTEGDAGSMLNISGIGILDSSQKAQQALEVIKYFLSPRAQSYFSQETFEYPLLKGAAVAGGQPPLESLNTPDIDLSDLEDIEATIELLRSTGAL